MMSTAELTSNITFSPDIIHTPNLDARLKRELKPQFVALSKLVSTNEGNTLSGIPWNTTKNGIRTNKRIDDGANFIFGYEEDKALLPKQYKAILEIVAHPDAQTGNTKVTQIRFGDSVNGTIVFEIKQDGHTVVYGIPPKNGMLPADFWLMQGKSFELFIDTLQKRSVFSKPLAATMSVIAAVSIACSSFPGVSQGGQPTTTVEGAGETIDTQEIPLDQIPQEVFKTVEDSCVKVQIQYRGSKGETVKSFSSGTITEVGDKLVIATVKHSFTGEKLDDPNTKELDSYTPESVAIEYKGVKLPPLNFSDAADYKIDDIKDFGVLGINLARLKDLAGGSLPDFKAAPVNPNWIPRDFDTKTTAKPLISCGYPGSTQKKHIRALTYPVVKNKEGFYEPILPPLVSETGNQNYFLQRGTALGTSGGGVFT